MITVSDEFKDAVKQLGSERASYLTDGVDPIYHDDDLRSIKLVNEGQLLKTIMRWGEAKFVGDHNYLDKYINIGSGVRVFEPVVVGTVTMTIATPAVFTLTAHGLKTGDKIEFETDGSLPTGLATDTIYYVISLTNNTFRAATTLDNAYNGVAINTTGSQSGTHTLINHPLEATGDIEYIDYGSFYVDYQKTTKGSDEITIKFRDRMFDAMVEYDLEAVFPMTVSEFLQAICARFSWTLASGSEVFPNSERVMEADPFIGLQMTYRDVLDDIAEVAASTIRFDTSDELVVAQVVESPIETLDKSTLMTLEVQKQYGAVNSVVLSRQPQEDNIAKINGVVSSGSGGEESGGEGSGSGIPGEIIEIKIVNNWVMDSDRVSYIDEIYDELHGLTYHPFKADTLGMGYYDVGDRIIVKDPNDNEYQVVIFSIELNFTGGITEVIQARIPDATETKYQYAGIIGRRIKNTEIIVNKQEGTITILTGSVNDSLSQITLSIDAITSAVNQAISLGDVNADQIEDLQTDVSTLQQTAEALELAIAGVGGTNLLKNSVGLKGNIEDWQILDSNGDPVDADNDGTVVQTSEVANNSESGSAIRLQEQFIQQTFPTIIGETYTFYCRYKAILDVSLSITGQSVVTMPASTDYIVQKIQFVASSVSTTLNISNVSSGSGADAYLTDNVVKLGDAGGWVQAPNEVYGSNYRFDKDGFVITSLSNTFKAVLDNISLTISDTAGGEKIIAQFSKDSALTTNHTVQDELILQRYGNPASSMRLIPVDDGAMLVIND